MSVLRIIRGNVGSGKSTFAKTFGCVVYEADMFFMVDGQYVFDKVIAPDAHRWCSKKVYDTIQDGIDVCVANTFTMKWEFAKYIEFAKNHNYKIEVYKMIRDYGNVHNVPEAIIEIMKNRWEDYPGEIEIG